MTAALRVFQNSALLAVLIGCTSDITAPAAQFGRYQLRAINGKVLRSFDPCGNLCSVSGLTFAPDGSLAYLTRDKKAGLVSLRQGGVR